MSSIELKNVCLDYVFKAGSESIKKTAIHLCNTLIRKTFRHDQAIASNTSFRALNNINLEIHKRDRVGLLGKNGAGKSTLLRVLAKIYRPNIGSIHVNGKISGLFDVSLGLNPEATGYENIVNLAIMRGLSRAKSQSIIGDVESFTELGDFLSKPVRTYSSGMQMKLAFAVATASFPEIMLVDEVIGVGDMHFMKKARQRMESIIDSSHILVLTSHSNDIISHFCNKVIVLDRGEIQFMGDVGAGIAYYKDSQLAAS